MGVRNAATFVEEAGSQRSPGNARNSVAEMRAAVLKRAGDVDVIVMAAAVSDFRAASPQATKLKKEGVDRLQLELVRSTDILAELGAIQDRRCLLVGFAAEDAELEERAIAKLTAKRADLIVANDISREDVGFGTGANEVTVIDRDGVVARLEKAPKAEIARGILRVIAERLAEDV